MPIIPAARPAFLRSARPSRWRRRAAWSALGVLAVYVVALAAMFVVMRQPPPRVGEMAPDFTLPTVDRKSQVTLASFRGKQPVILVFGSYT